MRQRSRFYILCERFVHFILKQRLYWVNYEVRDRRTGIFRSRGTISVYARNFDLATAKVEKRLNKELSHIAPKIYYRFSLNKQLTLLTHA